MQETEITAAVAAAVARIKLRQAVIKDDAAFERTYTALQDALSRSWDKQVREALTASLERLAQLGAGEFSKADAEILMYAVERYLGPDAMIAATRGPALEFSALLYEIGWKEVRDAIPTGVDLTFKQPDLRALELTQRANLYWIGNSWNSYTDGLFRNALKDYYEQGYSRKKLMDRMASDFAGLGERGYVYWDLMADHTATKTREIGRIGAYDAGGIEYVQVRAHLDQRTTPICRSLHNRIIPVSRLKQQRDDYLNATSERNEYAAKEAWTMHGADANLDGVNTNKLPRGTAMPPYHFRCRTITVAYFKPSRDAIPTVQHGDGMSPAQRRKVDALSAQEHAANARDIRANAKTLQFNEKDFRNDLRKAILKHAEQDYGITDAAEYLEQARKTVASADHVSVRDYKGGLQYSFLSTKEKGYAVVDMNLQLRGCYGHVKEGAIEKCLRENLEKYQTMIMF